MPPMCCFSHVPTCGTASRSATIDGSKLSRFARVPPGTHRDGLVFHSVMRHHQVQETVASQHYRLCVIVETHCYDGITRYDTIQEISREECRMDAAGADLQTFA